MYTPVGYTALIQFFNIRDVLPHYRQSYITTGRAFVRISDNLEEHFYLKKLKEPNNPFNHIEFAIKYDGINLEILHAVFKKMEKNDVASAIKKHPASKYYRIMWFLYEFLTETQLDIPDNKKALPYVDVLDSQYYFTSKGVKSKRHAVNNNLMGVGQFCPMIRRTKILTEYIDQHFDEKAFDLIKKYNPKVIERAIQYLYRKETMSSYGIEREKPSPERMERFIYLLRQTPNIEELTKEKLIEIQNTIVDQRFKSDDYRLEQVYVGDMLNHYVPRIHYIAPKSEDVAILMSGLLETLKLARADYVHPVLVAAMISFGFVFIHPFEDGNGRIHRFLIHYVLSSQKFIPKDVIFPVSAVMLENIQEYDQILEQFSRPLMELIKKYTLSNEGILTVNQPTLSFYKYIDYTKMAEYLFKCIDKTIHEHFEREIEFLLNYDQAKREIQAIIDMPDRLIHLFIKFTRQNNGVLGQQKKDKYFNKLNDHEIIQLQSIVSKYLLTYKIDQDEE